MAFVAGHKLGPYEILAWIGAGGMGEVYRARDTKLEREVAIKVLPDAVAQNPERLARFEREAKVLAALNHPNIAQIYGVEQGALVMELVEGQTLKGPIPLQTALTYARQIADALEAAHEKGITHRDLKPANIKITPGGTVKVLDFGLAAVSHTPAPASGDPTDSPTVTLQATQAGVIVGTAAYMSPEQASGKPVDKRADIWAFGVVLFEMLSGQRLFRGETISHTLASVIKDEPNWDAVPVPVRRLLRRCLEKDPKRRLRDIADAMLLLEESPVSPERRHRSVFPWAVAGALAAALTFSLGTSGRAPRAAAARQFLQLDLDAGPDEVSQPALSPDGSVLVFVSKGQLATRRLDQAKVMLLAGTDGAAFPFFSPNGQWIGFFAERKLKKIALEGGAPQTLCDVPTPRGGSWGEDGFIIASLDTLAGLSRVPVAGGEPQPFTDTQGDPEGMTAHRWPQVLPGGRGVLFAATANVRGSLRVLAPGGKMKTLVANSTYGRYLPTGYLVYLQAGTLFAAPMDLTRLELTGPAVPLVQGVGYTPNVAHAEFDLAPSGTLVYVRGPGAGGRVVSWLDSSGTLTPILSKPTEYLYPRISPDGKRLAIILSQDNKNDLWVFDSVRDTMTRLTSGTQGDVLYPQWTPDGEFILYGSPRTLAWTRSDGSARADTGISAAPGVQNLWSISGDSKWLTFSGGGASWKIAVERSAGALRLGRPVRLLANAGVPAVSPDGHFLAYSSNQSGRSEVYVTSFSSSEDARTEGAAPRWQVSNQGGTYAIWSRSEQQLFYFGPDRRIWSVAYTTVGDSFRPEKPRVWSPKRLAELGNTPPYDIDPSGKRAAVFVDPGGEDPKPETHLRVLLNVGDELRRRAAASAKP